MSSQIYDRVEPGRPLRSPTRSPPPKLPSPHDHLKPIRPATRPIPGGRRPQAKLKYILAPPPLAGSQGPSTIDHAPCTLLLRGSPQLTCHILATYLPHTCHTCASPSLHISCIPCFFLSTQARRRSSSRPYLRPGCRRGSPARGGQYVSRRGSRREPLPLRPRPLLARPHPLRRQKPARSSLRTSSSWARAGAA